MIARLSLACLAAALLAGVLTACTQDSHGPAAEDGPPPRHIHATRGVVREVAEDRGSAVIRHEAIPDYMPRMTMELTVRDMNELVGISAGDEITFRLLATEDTHWIDQVKRVGRAAEGVAPATTPTFALGEAALAPGDPVPDEAFTSEHGEPLRLADLRGRAVAVTFIFTRCPLPDFCPRMSRNFALAREALLARPDAPTNWLFLSLSFDAAHDTPAVLRTYARGARGANTDRWLFAVAGPEVMARLAPRFNLLLREETGTISHNLRTVVLDPAGRLARQFDGNRWTAEELAGALETAARATEP